MKNAASFLTLPDCEFRAMTQQKRALPSEELVQQMCEMDLRRIRTQPA